MISRRLLMAARGGGGFVPAPFTASGPYSSALTVNEAIITQVHCHTNQSDGSYTPAEVVAYYLARGVGALQITDHDMVTAQPDGITTKISGNELSPSTQHIIATGSTYTRGATTDAQEIIDGIVAAGGKAHIAHPKWSTGMTYAEMAGLTDYLGMEMHNAHCVDGAGQNPVLYPGFALDRWTELLNAGHVVWGFSVDDIHTIGAYDAFDVGRLRVFVDENTSADVVGRIASGNFVADVSNYGVTPGFPALTDEGIAVTCAGATRIEAWGAGGLISSTAGTSIDYGFSGSEQYVRLVAVGEYVEPFTDALSDRWLAVDGTWAVAGGVLAVSSTSTHRRIILRRHREGDFTAQVDVKLGSGGDDGAALLFNVLNSSYYYMLRIGESSVSGYNNVLAVAKTTSNSFAADSQLDNAAFTATAGTWYTLKMDYAAGRIQAKVWERGGAEPDWMVDATDTTWMHGAFGFRANYTAEFDNLDIDGFKTYYQPVTIG